MKHILILGSEGFIGNHLVSHFLKQGFTVSGGDLFEVPSQSNYQYYKVSRLSPELEDVFGAQLYDYCVNAAGSGNVSYSMTHPVQDFEANTLDPIRILDIIRRTNPSCKYVHLSSAAVYGNPASLPVDENFILNPLSAYGWHKLMSEHICKEYQSLYGINTAILRPFSIYGNGLKKQLLWDICNKFQQADQIRLFGTGKESRDFLHVKDLAGLIGAIINSSDFTGNIYNAASGVETTIRDIALLFEKYFGTNKKINFTGEVRKGDPLNWRADISKAKELGFTPSINLEQGIQQYIEWFRQLNPR